MRRTLVREPWVLFLAAAVVLSVAANLVGDAGGLVRAFVGVATIVVAVWAIRRRRPAAAGAWALLVVGVGFWVVGDAVWDWVTYRGTDGVTIYAADTLYLIAYPILAAGLVWLVVARGPAHSRDGFFDGGILALAGALLVWTFLVEPLSGGLGLTDRIIVSAYPLGDGLLVAGIMWLALTPGRRGMSLWLLMGALGVVLADDVFYNIAVRVEATETWITWLNPWWTIAYAMVAAALLHPSSVELGKPIFKPVEERAHPARLLFLGVALVVSAAVALTRDGGDVMITGLSLAITGLVIGRFVTLVRENERAHAIAAANAERFRLVASGSPVGIYEVNLDLTITFANEEGVRLLGRPVEGANARDLVALVDQRDRARARATVESVLAGQRASADLRLKEREPDERWVSMTVAPVHDEHGNISGALASLFDITAIKRAEETLARQATHDPLTGLPNRRLLLDRLGIALRRLARTHGHVAVMFLDLDRFKLVNDLLGHDVGDALLREVSTRLAANVRGGDTAARFGGDEFVVLVEDFENEDILAVAAERLLEAIALPMRLAAHDLRVSASIGITIAGPDDTDPDAILRDADAAMYRAKELGRDRVEIFSGNREPSGDLGPAPAGRLPY